MRADAIIIGAGLAGAATAYHLTRDESRDVVILEQERTPGFHSSGRSAAMVRQLVPEEPIASLARQSVRFLEGLEPNWGSGDLFHAHGSFLLATQRGRAELERQVRSARRDGVTVHLLEPRAAIELAPALRETEFAVAAHTPSDGTVDAGVLLRGFLRHAQMRGSRVVYGTRVVEVLRDAAGRVRGVATDDFELEAPIVVNAAGPWAGEVGALADATPLAFTSYRRHVARTAPDGRRAPSPAFVWDVDRDAYFRPDRSGTLLVCGCDHQSHPPADALVDTAALDASVAKALDVFPALRPIEVAHFWAGLRTYASDRLFVLGPDPKREGFVWAAGLGGHGITTSPAVGRLVAESILTSRAAIPACFAPSTARVRASA